MLERIGFIRLAPLVVPLCTTSLKSGRCSVNTPLNWCKKDASRNAELCSLWRSAPYKLAFNELTQEVELDEAPLPVVEIDEAYIGLSIASFGIQDGSNDCQSIHYLFLEGCQPFQRNADVYKALIDISPRQHSLSIRCRAVPKTHAISHWAIEIQCRRSRWCAYKSSPAAQR